MSDNEKDWTAEVIDLCNAGELEWRSYSGRGMYGKRCLGITTDSPERAILTLIQVAVDLGFEGEDLQDLLLELDNMCTDSMGRSAIVYWPKFEMNGSGEPR